MFIGFLLSRFRCFFYLWFKYDGERLPQDYDQDLKQIGHAYCMRKIELNFCVCKIGC